MSRDTYKKEYLNFFRGREWGYFHKDGPIYRRQGLITGIKSVFVYK